MASIEQRIERLETLGVDGKPLCDEIVRWIIRPGDLKCIAEIRWKIGDTSAPVTTRFDSGNEGFQP